MEAERNDHLMVPEVLFPNRNAVDTFRNLSPIVWSFIDGRYCKGSLIVQRYSQSSYASNAARLLAALPHDCGSCGDCHPQKASHCRPAARQSPR